MKGFPKALKTKEDYYNCLAMVAAGELAAADLLAKIESLDKQRYIQCAVVAAQPEKKAVTVYYCDEAKTGMEFLAGEVAGKITAVTHSKSEEAQAAGEEANDRTELTLSKATAPDISTIGLKQEIEVAGMTAEDIEALKGVLKQYE